MTRVRDSGGMVARCLVGGIGGGALASAWAAALSGLGGRPLWAPLALYHTTFLGFSRSGIAARGLATAVVAGVVWQVLAGMVAGALFALVAGALVPARTLARAGWLVGAVYGALFWMATVAARLPLESRAAAENLPAWAAGAGFALTGLVIGASAARGLAAGEGGGGPGGHAA